MSDIRTQGPSIAGQPRANRRAELPVTTKRLTDREWWRENLSGQLAKIEEWNRRRAEKGRAP